MPEYRVTAGTHRTGDGDRAEAGDIIELSADEAAQFQNKLELVESESKTDSQTDTDTVAALDEDAHAEVEAEVEKETGSAQGATDDDVGGVEAAGNVPDDYALLSKMAKHYDGDEIHGAMSGDEIAGFLEGLSDTEVAALKQQAKQEMSDES